MSNADRRIEIGEKDMVNHPKHYNRHPSGVECIDIAEHMSFNTGGAFKYMWRMWDKGCPIEDLGKAKVLIEREIELLSDPRFDFNLRRVVVK